MKQVFVFSALIALILAACAGPATPAPTPVSVKPEDFIGKAITITSYKDDEMSFQYDGQDYLIKAKSVRLDQPGSLAEAELDATAYALSAFYLTEDFNEPVKARVKEIIRSDSTVYALEQGEIVLVVERILH